MLIHTFLVRIVFLVFFFLRLAILFIYISIFLLLLLLKLGLNQGFPGGSESKASACNAGDLGSIPGPGRSPGEGNSNPLQCSCLENPMDGGALWATVHGVTKSQT